MVVANATTTSTQRNAGAVAGESRPNAAVSRRSRGEAVARTAAEVVLLPVTVAQQTLPRSRPAVYYAGLAGAALTGVIDWPVAAIAAAAVWAVRQPGTSADVSVRDDPSPVSKAATA